MLVSLVLAERPGDPYLWSLEVDRLRGVGDLRAAARLVLTVLGHPMGGSFRMHALERLRGQGGHVAMLEAARRRVAG